MNEPRTGQAYYQELFYRLLPALYRARDGDGELRRFLDLFGHETARLRGSIDQLWRDFYVDSCQDWVIPYIADLLGTEVLFRDDAVRNRADVKSTLGWRRRKGTLDGLEDVAAVTSGWGALAVEMFERLIWCQNLGHLKPQARHAVDLADGSRLDRVGTPFELEDRSVDLRPADHRVGWHRIRNVSFFLWRIPSHSWRGAMPVAEDPGRWRFHPLGVDLALHAGGDRGTICDGPDPDPAPRPDVCFARTDHVAIRDRDFRDHPQVYFGSPAGFSVYEDGILLCRSHDTAPSQSLEPATAFAELAATGGLRVADESLFGPGQDFRVEALRLAAADQYSSIEGFGQNFVIAGAQASLDVPGFVYSKGLPFDEGPRALLLRIERLGASATFPECELILRSDRGRHLLAFLPELNGLVAGQPFHLYLADDGSAYHGRALHDAGDPDRNPDSGLFGAFLPRHLARGAEGQVRPRPGVRPVSHRLPVYRRLCCWDQDLARPLQPGEVAFDPERGRFRFPPGEEPQGELTVDFRFALTGEAGAGPFARDTAATPTHTVSPIVAGPYPSVPHFATVQSALNAAAGSADPVIVEILDSRTYAEALTLSGDFPGGLTIRAAALEMPVIHPAAGDPLTVPAARALAGLTLDGVVIAGGALRVAGDVAALGLRFCTLDPGSAEIVFHPAQADAELALSHVASGPVDADANVARIRVSDSIVHHPDAAPDAAAGHPALATVALLALERSTVLGEIAAGVLTASNSILVGPLTVGDPDASCVRYSRHSKLAPPMPTFRSTTAFAIFVTTRFAAAGYMHLHPNTAAAIRRGAEEGGEMGAFYQAGIPWRRQNAGIRLAEYLPAGLQANLIPVLPTARFSGVKL